MGLDAKESQLILMDYQEKNVERMADSALFLKRALHLAKMAQLFKLPIWGAEQVMPAWGGFVPDLAGFCQSVLTRHHFSAVAEGLTDVLTPQKPILGNARSLPKHLQKNIGAPAERRSIVLAGCEIHIGVLQTALDLLDDDWDVSVVVDACASHSAQNHDAALDRLAAAGAELLTIEMLGFEWLQTSAGKLADDFFKLLHDGTVV